MAEGEAVSWLTRTDLGARRGSTAKGILLVSGDAEVTVALTPEALEVGAAITRDTLRSVGVGPADRVLIALNNDGELTGANLAGAVAGLAGAVASVGPRSRMRILRAIDALAPTVLITTPTGASDLLSRVHIEFLLDPLEFGLQKLVLTGEISTEHQLQHLGDEFGAEVSEVYADPFHGVMLARRAPGDRGQTVVTPGMLEVGALDNDAPVAELGSGPAELLVRPAALGLEDVVLRTGQVVVGDCADAAADLPLWRHTVGDHVLIRGRWVSIPLIRRALVKIDAIRGWSLEVSREGTLDRARLVVALERSLKESKMWVGRIEEALRTVSPVHIAVEPVDAEGWSETGALTDRRGHHLGLSRTGGG